MTHKRSFLSTLSVLLGFSVGTLRAEFVPFTMSGAVLERQPSTPAATMEQRPFSAGRGYSVAVAPDGTVWAWGLDIIGAVVAPFEGLCEVRACSTVPVQVPGISNVVAISAKDFHILALKSDGTVWAWGYNFAGQLGDGTTITRLSPAPVIGLNDVVAVQAGSFHSMALKSDGTLWTWGNNSYNQLGAPTAELCGGTGPCSTTAIQVPGLAGVANIAGGDRYSLALKTDGTVWAWGNASLVVSSVVPGQVASLNDIVAISAGGDFHVSFALALKSDGTVWGWGFNNNGQLGNGTTTSSATPIQAALPSGITAVSAGGRHSLALRSDGTVWGWGANRNGQLGDGTVTFYDYPPFSTPSFRSTPVQALGIDGQGVLNGVVSIAAARAQFEVTIAHSLALKSDGTLVAWGANSGYIPTGALGDGTTLSKSVPVVIADATSDRDNDGVLDSSDVCRTTPGASPSTGCPFDIKVVFSLNTAGTGSGPQPVAGVRVRVFDQNNPDFLAIAGGKNPDPSRYPAIFETGKLCGGCAPGGLVDDFFHFQHQYFTVKKYCSTDANGECPAVGVPSGEYLVITRYVEESSGCVVYAGHEVQTGNSTGGQFSASFNITKVANSGAGTRFFGRKLTSNCSF